MLGTLVPGGATSERGLIVGDMRYSGFTFRSQGPLSVTAEEVAVEADNNGFLPDVDNLRFTFGADAAPGQSGRVVIGYRAEVLGTPFRDFGRFGTRNPDVSVPDPGPGAASVAVTHTISTVNGADLDPAAPGEASRVLELFTDGPGGLEDTNALTVFTGRNRSVLASKEITFSADPAVGGRITVVQVDRYVLALEPSCGTAMLAALALLGRRRSRRLT